MAMRLSSLAATVLFAHTVFAQTPLPQVDLGYEIHQAISFNESAQLYNFSNIRFAQPPIGDLRFAAPVPPVGRNQVVQNGSVGRICPQASPGWGFVGFEFAQALVAGNGSQFNFTQAEEQLQTILSAPPAPPDPRTTEDCLFLDVVVPKKVFDNANNLRRRKSGTGAPVLVWIYGGGYTGGSKDSAGNPTGLIQASQADGSDGIIFVALNYRLGAFGFLSGPTLQASGGVSNAGFYDQRLAIEWVANFIHLFGGDPNQITLIGESAGGGSITHQITAFGGEQGFPFQKAIVQSPGIPITTSQFAQENATQSFLALLNVSTIEEARKVPSETVIAVNAQQIAFAPFGSVIHGPVVDGIFTPSLPGLLLARGDFAQNISVMVGHNTRESPYFTPSNVQTDADLRAFLKFTYPSIPDPVADFFINELYPAKYDGSQPYSSPLERILLVVQEGSFVCNNNFLNRAFDNNTFAYEFQVLPALHAQDVPFTFYNGQGSDPSTGLIASVAQTLQGYITNFAKTGNPNGPGLPYFPKQGSNATELALNATYIQPQLDLTANSRCAWWQQGLFT